MVFLPLTVLLSAPAQVAVITTGQLVWGVPLMFAPGLAAMATRLLLREGFADVSFRIGGARGWRWIGLALLLPIVAVSAGYAIAWLTGLAEFFPHAGLGSRVGLDDPELPAWLRLAGAVALGVPLSSAVGLVLGALGEEVGWRGYLLPRLIDAGAPRPVLFSGVVWALWHTPLIVAGVYLAGSHRVLVIALFSVNAILFGYLLGWLRLGSGSVWPAAVGHAAWNAVVQGVFDKATTGAQAWLWVGEQGLLLIVANLVLVVTLTVRDRPVLRWPGGRAEHVARL